MLPIRFFSVLGEPLVRVYLRHIPIERGKWGLWCWAARHGVLSCRRKTILRTKYGFYMEVDTSEFIDQFIYYWKCWEPDESRIVHRLLRPGDNFVDVGANVGYYTLLGSMLVGPNGSVYSFEPSPATYERLLRNIRLNTSYNITTFAKACGDHASTLPLSCISSRNPGANTLLSVKNASQRWTVDIIRIDECLSVDKHYRLVKIDVEGFEPFVLKGMSNLFYDRSVDYILCELTESWLNYNGTSIRDIFAYMETHGFTPFVIHNGKIIKANAMKRDTDQLNVLFAHRDCQQLENEN